jgi:hypothetical protein
MKADGIAAATSLFLKKELEKRRNQAAQISRCEAACKQFLRCDGDCDVCRAMTKSSHFQKRF